jgi:hypothetical protein
MSEYVAPEFKCIDVTDGEYNTKRYRLGGKIVRIHRPNDNQYQVTYASGRIRLFDRWQVWSAALKDSLAGPA